ncbi:hypothetical protein C4D60_Mb06t09790 [Musa balbisiana]|uniref:Uncharacterized protein n=1 Tax=Musa balbisiana TaxID=52838 RepID=A0A4S8ILW3_MUSBA|nr:hypothetical protein C4D60_Mb06t09790 [Musa balbisiana]
MGFMGTKQLAVLSLVILASLPSTALAGRQRRLYAKYAAPAGAITKESAKINEPHQEQVLIVRSRILRIKTNDYGSYDPSPSLSKPPFKLIPN